MSTEYSFTITTPLEVEETVGETVILTGTFLRLNKATNNGREYLIEEGLDIAEGLVDMPVGFGADWMNKHIKDPANHVGRVLKAWLDKVTNTIKGKVQIWNTSKFPNIIEKVKAGWGFSIGGTAEDLKPTGLLNRIGRAIMKVVGMKPNHLQLLEPKIKRGQSEAQVEGLEEVEETFYEIEETMMFDPCPWGICDIPQEITIMESEIVIKKDDWDSILDRLSKLESITKEDGTIVTGKVIADTIVTNLIEGKDSEGNETGELTFTDGKTYLYTDGKMILAEGDEEIIVNVPIDDLPVEEPVTETNKYKQGITYIIPGKGVSKIRHG